MNEQQNTKLRCGNYKCLHFNEDIEAQWGKIACSIITQQINVGITLLSKVAWLNSLD